MSLLPLFATNERHFSFEWKSFPHIIVDRGSKYTVSGGRVSSRAEVDSFMKRMLSNKTFSKATHNTYAWRICVNGNEIQEGKNDDGETGAGNVILRELEAVNLINGIIVVTRYYGGVRLYADRFKHVRDAARYFFEHENEKTMI